VEKSPSWVQANYVIWLEKKCVCVCLRKKGKRTGLFYCFKWTTCMTLLNKVLLFCLLIDLNRVLIDCISAAF